LFNTLSFSLKNTPAPKLLKIFRVKTRNETSTIVDPLIKIKFDVAARCRIQVYSQETAGSGAVRFKFECDNLFNRAIKEENL